MNNLPLNILVHPSKVFPLSMNEYLKRYAHFPHIIKQLIHFEPIGLTLAKVYFNHIMYYLIDYKGIHELHEKDLGFYRLHHFIIHHQTNKLI